MKYEDRPDFLRRWSKGGFTLYLFETGKRKSTGQEILRYVFKDRGKTIFEGADFGASPLHAIDSDDAVYSLLNFLSMGVHDTDADYFASYTPAQIAWRDSSRREELAMLVYEFDQHLTKFERKEGFPW